MAVPTPTYTDGQTRNITNVNRDAAPVAIKISVRCRLSEAVNTTASAELTRAVGKENLLLQTYDIFLPPPHQRAAWLVPGNRDIVGSRILQTFYPSLVQHAVSLAVQGDGNCLFRAVSRLLYGKENMHKLLRLLTALEIGSFPQYYDPSDVQYVSLVGNAPIQLPDYMDTLQTACTLGASSEICHIYALSAVIDMPMQSVYTRQLMCMWTRGTGRLSDVMSMPVDPASKSCGPHAPSQTI